MYKYIALLALLLSPNVVSAHTGHAHVAGSPIHGLSGLDAVGLTVLVIVLVGAVAMAISSSSKK